MRPRQALLALGTAALLLVSAATPALGRPSPPASGISGGGFAALLGGACGAGYTPPTKVDNGQAIEANAVVECSSSVDFIAAFVHLSRADGPQELSPNLCMSTTSWTVVCPSTTPCVTGYYTVHATYQASSTSGYFDQEKSYPYAYWISC